jgi:hypothetical protein
MAPLAHGQNAPSEAPETQYQNPFADYVPFEDEYDVDEDERFMYFGKAFAVGMGTGANVFGGNIGKLYNTALPVFNFNLLYFFDFRFAGQIYFGLASHAFSASPNGFVEVKMMRFGADLKYYFDTRDLSAAITSVNPYIIAGAGNTLRTQVFQDFGTIDKDTALGVSVGMGMEFALSPRSTSLSLEGRLHQIFFKDRYSQEYLVSGIEDTTGPMYSLGVGVLFFF